MDDGHTPGTHRRLPKEGCRELRTPEAYPCWEKFLKKPTSFKITDSDEETEDQPASGGTGASGESTDPVLFAIMKDLREEDGAAE